MLEPTPLIFFHKNCPDGTTAAWAAIHSGVGAELHPLQHGDKTPIPKKKRPVYFLDYCPKTLKELEAIEDAIRPYKLIVIDHHNTAQKVLVDRTPHLTVFNEDHSGARLAWDYFNTSQSRPAIIDYVEDRDLWAWKMPQSREVNAWISTFPLNKPEMWYKLAERIEKDLQGVVKEGAVILRYQQTECALAMENALSYNIPTPTGFMKVRGVNIGVRSIVSDVAGELAKDAPFGMCWWVDGRGLCTLSLRVRDEGPHVGKISQWFKEEYDTCISGGGHPKAAGSEWTEIPDFIRKR